MKHELVEWLCNPLVIVHTFLDIGDFLENSETA